MTSLEDLESKIAGAHWFRNLGMFGTRKGFISITDQIAWRAHTAVCLAHEFGLPEPQNQETKDYTILNQMDWLPSSQSDADPFHGNKLVDVIAFRDNSALLRVQRTRLAKLVLTSLRDLRPNEWLKFGATDYTEAARQSLVFAMRMAVTEIIAGTPAIWCECVNVYVGGNWPCGRLPTGEIVVI